jgi:hypothetical protein
MIRLSKTRAAALAIISVATLLTAAPAIAATPTVQSSERHIERPFVDCPDFSVTGSWDLSSRLTTFYDADGTAIRDIERVEFAGRLINTASGSWVADSGARTFFDTLAPDGSYLTTYMVSVRKSQYVHTAGRTDFQTGAFSGHDGLDAAGVAALCETLGG